MLFVNIKFYIYKLIYLYLYLFYINMEENFEHFFQNNFYEIKNLNEDIIDDDLCNYNNLFMSGNQENNEVDIPPNLNIFSNNDNLSNLSYSDKNNNNENFNYQNKIFQNYKNINFNSNNNNNIITNINIYNNNCNNNNITLENLVTSKKNNKKINKINFKYSQIKDIEIEENVKKPLFEIYSNLNDFQKQKKLLMNRISAKKSRLKRKKYISLLEDELKKNKNILEEKKQLENIYLKETSKKENIINKVSNAANSFDILVKKEKEIKNNKNNLINENKIKEYCHLQFEFMKKMFIAELELLMPLKCKLFAKKYLKLENFEDDDNLNIVLNKVKNNLIILKELYNFEKKDLEENKKSKDIQLYKFFINIKKIILLIQKLEKIYL